MELIRTAAALPKYGFSVEGIGKHTTRYCSVHDPAAPRRDPQAFFPASKISRPDASR
jgi:hypothetical protein